MRRHEVARRTARRSSLALTLCAPKVGGARARCSCPAAAFGFRFPQSFMSNYCSLDIYIYIHLYIGSIDETMLGTDTPLLGSAKK